MEGPVGIGDLVGHRHAFLIRDPRRVVASYAAKRIAVRPEHLGLHRQRAWFEREADRIGRAPPVVDSGDILADPAGTLSALCAALGLAWDPAMLRWAPGQRQTDGVWARHWYGAVEASTGFGPPEEELPSLGRAEAATAKACLADYRWLRERRCTPGPGV